MNDTFYPGDWVDIDGNGDMQRGQIVVSKHGSRMYLVNIDGVPCWKHGDLLTLSEQQVTNVDPGAAPDGPIAKSEWDFAGTQPPEVEDEIVQTKASPKTRAKSKGTRKTG